MNRFRSGLVPLVALLGLAACSSEPTDELRDGPAEIVASPSRLFIEVGGTRTVEIGALDAQGNPLQFNYEVTATGPGITVRRDSTFLPIFVNDSTLQAPPVGERFRFIVEGGGYTSTSFTVSAGGLNVVVPVRVVPEEGVAATFDDDTVDLGQVVTVTAPAGVSFDETTFLTIGADTLTIVTQDATNIAFIPPPSVNAPVTINNVTAASAPGTIFSPVTQTTLVTPLIDTVAVGYSNLTPALNEVVTMTSPDPLIDLVVDSIIFPGQIPGSREGDPQSITPSADSSSLTFITPPNVNGQATVVNFHFPGGYLRALPTRDTVISPNIGTTIAATFDDTEPALLQPVTLTAPAGFTFDATTNVTVGGNLGITQSVAGDGSSVTFIPIPGSAGVASVDGVVSAAAPANILTMLTVETMTVPPLIPLEGTGSVTTAPTIPAPGTTVDAGSFGAADCGSNTDAGAHCQAYKISFAAQSTLTYTLTAPGAADLGLYFMNAADFTELAPPQACDSQGRASPPESCSITFEAGDYILMVINFGPLYPEADPDPPFVQIDIN